MPARRWACAAAGAGLTVSCLLAGDRSFFGASGVGVYDPAPVQASWRALAATGRVTPIDRLSALTDAQGQRDLSIRRANQMARAPRRCSATTRCSATGWRGSARARCTWDRCSTGPGPAHAPS